MVQNSPLFYFIKIDISSTDKMLKLLGRMPWLWFEPRYLHLCVCL